MATIATISEKRCEKSQPHAVRHALLHKKAKPFLKVTLRILPKTRLEILSRPKAPQRLKENILSS